MVGGRAGLVDHGKGLGFHQCRMLPASQRSLRTQRLDERVCIQESLKLDVIPKLGTLRTCLQLHVLLARMPDRIHATRLESVEGLIAEAMYEMAISAEEFKCHPT